MSPRPTQRSYVTRRLLLVTLEILLWQCEYNSNCVANAKGHRSLLGAIWSPIWPLNGACPHRECVTSRPVYDVFYHVMSYDAFLSRHVPSTLRRVLITYVLYGPHVVIRSTRALVLFRHTSHPHESPSEIRTFFASLQFLWVGVYLSLRSRAQTKTPPRSQKDTRRCTALTSV